MIICGTGHRPDKLGGYDATTASEVMLLALNWLIDHPEVTHVISGGALGWDQALAKAARAHGVTYTMALPFPGFEDRWPQESKLVLHGLIHDAKDTKFVCDAGYAGWKMQKRNEWMVDNAEQVLALWNGTPGGTANCIGYAKKVGKPIVNLWEGYQYQGAR